MILAAARVCGITEIYKAGGAGAIAALAYGTATVPAVNKIVGPGSIYVTLAKKHVYGETGIDGLYGPSEVVVLADATAELNLAPQLAADLVAQAEHGTDSFVCLVTTSVAMAEAVQGEVDARLQASPRGAILSESMRDAPLLAVGTDAEAVELCSLAASEHVEIWSRNALDISSRVRDAGAIFLNCPVPLGDYIAGPSHTLPTGTSARFSHGIGVDTFLKRTSLIAAPPHAVSALADDLEILANLEELPGHAAAVRAASARSAEA